MRALEPFCGGGRWPCSEDRKKFPRTETPKPEQGTGNKWQRAEQGAFHRTRLQLPSVLVLSACLPLSHAHLQGLIAELAVLKSSVAAQPCVQMAGFGVQWDQATSLSGTWVKVLWRPPLWAFLYWQLLWSKPGTQRSCLCLKGQPCNPSGHAALKGQAQTQGSGSCDFVAGPGGVQGHEPR